MNNNDNNDNSTAQTTIYADSASSKFSDLKIETESSVSTSTTTTDPATNNETTTTTETTTLKMKKSRIYTKTGDRGESSLYSGRRKPKDDLIFEALGTVDELNAHVGLARDFCAQSGEIEKLQELMQQLETIQSRLLDLGACIATPIDTTTNETKLRKVHFSNVHVTVLEGWIDTFDSQLPPLRNFILPSGGLSASQLHILRTVCRRAERCVVPLVRDGVTDPVVQIYLNRMSDYFFVAARWAAMKQNKEEVIYRAYNETNETAE